MEFALKCSLKTQTGRGESELAQKGGAHFHGKAIEKGRGPAESLRVEPVHSKLGNLCRSMVLRAIKPPGHFNPHTTTCTTWILSF